MVYTGVTTQLAQMIPVIVLSGTVTELAKGAVPGETKEKAVTTFNEVSRADAIETVGRSGVDIAKKNPNTIFHTTRGEVMYSDGRYFVR